MKTLEIVPFIFFKKLVKTTHDEKTSYFNGHSRYASIVLRRCENNDC